MRISATCGDEGYENYRLTKYFGCKVYLDGALFKEVMAADAEEGYIEIIKRGSDGKMVIAHDGNVATTRRYGHVRIELRE